MSRRLGVVWVVLAALLTPAGCGGSGTPVSATGVTAARRAACYPSCLSRLVERCPLINACTANFETSSSVPPLGESDGIAICFSDGEREREATDINDHAVVYVKAADGAECYAAVGDQQPGIESWDLSVGGQLFGYLTWDLVNGAVAVSCDGTTTVVDVTNPACAGVPWQATGCDMGQSCTFGQVPAAGAWDGGTPPPPCDPTLCTTPPPRACESQPVTNDEAVADYSGAPTCDDVNGCIYPKSLTPCDHGCYLAQCTGPLTAVSNVTGSATVGGAVHPVFLNDGGAPAGSAVTVTARTSPRGAASSVKVNYGTCPSGTFCSTIALMFMSHDPSTPDGQTDYDQWTITFAAQSAGTSLQFQLYATEPTGNGILSQAAPSTPWSYTSN